MSRYIYGKYPISSFVSKYPDQVTKLWYVDDKHLSVLNSLLGNSSINAIELLQISNKELRRKFSLKEFESHQGLVLEIKKDLNDFLFDSLENLLIESSHQNKILLWLPSIQDTNNLGAVVRSAVALKKVHGIIIPSAKTVRLTPAVAKISAGTIFDMKFASFNSYTATANNISSSGIKLISVEKNAKSISLWNVDFRNLEPFVLVIGSEDKGIPEKLRSFCDLSIEIPQSEVVDSLNLSVACSIVLYEYLRQNDTEK